MAKDWVIRERPAIEPLVPDYERDLHDPFLMKDLELAVDRLWRAVREGERVMIFADYDADGVPGAAVLVSFFRKINFHNFSVYLPDRQLEDYGLSRSAIDQAKQDGVSLIVTIDCGIANRQEVVYANDLGLEVIVTDHHLVPDDSPIGGAVAVVNPKRADCAYPDKNLCGAGVVFKLVQGLIRASGAENFPQVLGNNPRGQQRLSSGPRKQSPDRSESLCWPLVNGWEKWLLDLVAIATVSDMVPLSGENRALVHFGLKVLRKSPRPGIVELCRALRLRQEFVNEDDIAFLIGPRLNAASRMAHASEALELLTTENAAIAATLARRLENLNKERRKCVEAILSSDGSFPLEKPPAPPLIVSGHESWPIGVLGLAAARLAEKHRRPTFVWGKNGNDMIKGSCRSDGSVNVVELMRAADLGLGHPMFGELQHRMSKLFLNVGGHRQAGGFSLAAERLAELEPRLLAALSEVKKETMVDRLELDAELELAQVTETFWRELSRLAPFGIENPKPVFLFRRINVTNARTFGGTGSHLELHVQHRTLNIVKAVSFFNTFPELKITAGRAVDLAAAVELSYFRRQPELRLRIVDLRLVE